jgi:cell division protein FtsL
VYGPAPRSLRRSRPAPRAGLIIRLPRSGKLLDSIVRGRAWIPVLGVLLVGIVGMRVEVLKLGSSVGVEMQQASQLQSANAVMLNQVSALADNTRIEQLADKQGMVMPLPLDLHFVRASGTPSVNRAIADVTEPAPATFLSSLLSEREQDGESIKAAAKRSAVGVLGGGSITAGTTSATSATTSTTLTTPSTQAATDQAATDQTATDQTPTTTLTVAPSGAAGATDNVPSVTNTATNGAASLAG